MNDYAGYSTEDDVRDTDQRVRAYVGERLADLQARLPSAADALEAPILRMAFSSGEALRGLEHPQGSVHAGALEAADAALLDAADAADAVDDAGASAYIARIQAAIDARDAAMISIER